MSMKRQTGEQGTGGAPLVILPGLLCDGRMFKHQHRTLGGQVIEGFYGTADRIEAMADYALERMPARCSVLGHSMGARVALEVWRRAPGRVARLALADTGVHPVSPGEAAGRHALRDLGREEGDAGLIDAWLPPMIGDSRRGDQALLAQLRAMTVEAGVVTYARQIEALLHRPDAAAVLPTIDCPTVVIVGDEDRWSPPAQHEGIAAAIPGAYLRVVAGAGHMAPAEQPEAFTAVLAEWLSSPD